jgi:hypothetical protein
MQSSETKEIETTKMNIMLYNQRKSHGILQLQALPGHHHWSRAHEQVELRPGKFLSAPGILISGGTWAIHQQEVRQDRKLNMDNCFSILL